MKQKLKEHLDICKDENIILVERDHDKGVGRISLNGQVLFEEFIYKFNGKGFNLHPALKELQHQFFVFNSIAELAFMLRSFLLEEGCIVTIQNEAFSSSLNQNFHL